MRKLIEWVKRRLDTSPTGYAVLALASFLETIIVPIAIEIILVPYMALNRSKAWTIATVTLAGCMAGALLGYAVGAGLMETLGQSIVERFGWAEDYEWFVRQMDDYGFWLIILVGFIPVPFQIAMLGAGAANYPLLLFCLASLIARGIRYYGLALLVVLFKDRAKALWQRSRWATGIGAVVLLGLIFVASRTLLQAAGPG